MRQQLTEMEAKRDLTQTIVHVDMDAFYANVELLYNPDLKGKAFAVVSTDQHSISGFILFSQVRPQCGLGIVTTASYEARKYGARSGMPGIEPDIIISGAFLTIRCRVRRKGIMCRPHHRTCGLQARERAIT